MNVFIKTFKMLKAIDRHAPLSNYQNLTYNADSISRIEAIRAMDVGLILNISESSEKAFAFILGPARLINTIIMIVMKKDQPILMKNGIS